MADLPSITEVAQHAGVSISTVSHVMNGTKAVSAATRQKVEAAIVALGYKANPFGRSLRSGKSGVLLVLVPDFANPFNGAVLTGIEAVTRQHGYNLLLSDAGDLWSHHQSEQQALYSRMTEGVICLAPMPNDADVTALAPEVPWVSCSEVPPSLNIPYVSIDHRLAARDAVQYLLNRGHRRIALINSDERFLYASQRRKGYEQALTDAGIELDPALYVNTGPRGTDFAHGSQAATVLLATPHPPTAVFAISDRLAVGALKVFKRAGLKIPGQMAVMGFDDTPIAGVYEPGVSTVAQPSQALGEAATELLLQRLRGQPAPSRYLPHQLVLRESA